jgi:hypothetical protein
MELVVLELSYIATFIIPNILTLSINHIILEKANQNPSACMKFSKPFLLSILKLSTVSNLICSLVVLSKSMH